MDKQPHQPTPVSEEQIVTLLASLRVTQTPEADFEARFLAEFHERVAREAVCCPARRHVLTHLLQMLENVGRGRFAFGASALGLAAAALCYALYPAPAGSADTTAAVVREKQQSLPLLIPALSNDLVECTTVRIVPARSVFETEGGTVSRVEHAAIIEMPHTFVPAQRGAETQQGGGKAWLPSSAVRYAI